MFSTYLCRGLFKPRPIFARINGPIVAGQELLAGKQRCFETNSEIFLLRKECFLVRSHVSNVSSAREILISKCEPIFLTKMSSSSPTRSGKHGETLADTMLPRQCS